MFLCLTCSLNAYFDGYLGCIHLVFFLLLKIISLGLSTDTSTPSQYKLFYWDFWVSAWYLSINSLIHQAKFFGVSVCLITPRYLPRSIEIFCRWQLLDTSRCIELLFSIEARYLLDLLRCVFYIYFEVRPGFVQNQISLSLSLFSLDLKTFFSQKFFFPLHFRLNPSSISLVSALNLSFSHSFSCI